MRTILITGITLLLAGPLPAQEWQVARERFTFVGTRLTIEVDVESPGTLRILRGRPGAVEVAGRAERGFTGFGLDDRERLTLTAAGAGPVDYMVSVPDGVWIEVRLPDRYPHALGTLARSGNFEWGATTSTPTAGIVTPVPHPSSSVDPGLFTTYVDDLPPRLVHVPDLATVRRLTVRVEGDRFLVATGRPMALTPGSHESMEIRPAGDPMEITLVVPRATLDFTLRLADRSALTATGGAWVALCTPLTTQRLSDGTRIFTFIPGDGRLECQPEQDPRHRG